MAGRVKNYSICQEVKIADEVLYEQADGVAPLTLNRPEKYSTLRGDIFQVLGDALQRANTDEEVKAIILQGSSDAFCRGFDFSGDGYGSTQHSAQPLSPGASPAGFA